MVTIRSHRSHAGTLLALVIGPLLILGGCSQSAPADDVEKRIADADARAAAAEKRISIATHTAPPGNAIAQAPVADTGGEVGQPVVSAVPADGGGGVNAQDAPYRDSHSGPNHDVP